MGRKPRASGASGRGTSDPAKMFEQVEDVQTPLHRVLFRRPIRSINSIENSQKEEQELRVNGTQSFRTRLVAESVSQRAPSSRFDATRRVPRRCRRENIRETSNDVDLARR